MNIEKIAVNYVETALARTDYLVSHINENDKEPSWDGYVEVYREKGNIHAKADLIIKVPVQVKGHVSNELNKKVVTYPVQFVDMENYLNMGGTVFLVVYINEEGNEYQIYYAGLLPFELKKYIKSNNEKKCKTKNIKMKALPNNKEDIANVFLDFAYNMGKQRAAINSEEVSLKEILKADNIPKLFSGSQYISSNNLSPFDLMLRGNLYVYAELPYGIELPVEYIETVDKVGWCRKCNVTVKGTLFYSEFKVEYSKELIEFKFGKSIRIIINRNSQEKQEFKFTLQGTLSERIRDEMFIIEAITARQFEVGEHVFSFNEVTETELASFNLLQRKEQLNCLIEIRDVLNRLDCNVDLECDFLTSDDEANLQLLRSFVLDGLEVSVEDIQSPIYFMDVANLKLLVCMVESDTNPKLIKIQNHNDTEIETTAIDDDGSTYLTSYYVLLKKDVILKCSNLNFEKMFNQLKKIPLSDRYVEQVVMLLLELLKAYDESNGAREDIINGAKKIAKWIKEIDESMLGDVHTLNYYQVIKRIRELNDNEKQILLSIIESKPDSEAIYTGAYLLLDNQEAANFHYRKMDADTQSSFKEYPIYYFWK